MAEDSAWDRILAIARLHVEVRRHRGPVDDAACRPSIKLDYSKLDEWPRLEGTHEATFRKNIRVPRQLSGDVPEGQDF